MSLQNPIKLSEVHSELSCILFAVQEGLKDLDVTVEIDYNQHTYLGVKVDLWPHPSAREMRKKIIAVVARLQHGILWGEYDYRFTGVSHPPLDSNLEAWERYEVRATLDLFHWPHRRPYGWEDRQKPLEQRLSIS
jgi:hypothetical protein